MSLIMCRLPVFLCAAFVAGCAANGPDAQIATPANAAPASTDPQGGAYKLTDDELQLDCRKLTGRMQVRLLQMRGDQSRNKGSVLARTIQNGTAAVVGGPKVGNDPDVQFDADKAKLEAYNRRLAEKNCATFDLAAELALDHNAATPQSKKPEKPK